MDPASAGTLRAYIAFFFGGKTHHTWNYQEFTSHGLFETCFNVKTAIVAADLQAKFIKQSCTTYAH